MYILIYPFYLWPMDCKHLDEIDVFFVPTNHLIVAWEVRLQILWGRTTEIINRIYFSSIVL